MTDDERRAVLEVVGTRAMNCRAEAIKWQSRRNYRGAADWEKREMEAELILAELRKLLGGES